MIRYAHTNLIARDWKALSRFYQRVFGCIPTGPKRDLTGEWLDTLTGIPGAHLVGEHLVLPGHGDILPTIEIFSYDNEIEAERAVNAAGFSHIAFQVDNVQELVDRVVAEGGSLLAGISSRDYGEMGYATFAYVRDPEGNIIELQSWKK